MKFHENLRYLMDSKGLQIKELSSLSGVSENTLKTYLKENSSEPKISKVLALAKALNVSVEFLISDMNKKDFVESKLEMELLQVFSKLPDNKKKILIKIGKVIELNN